MHSRTSRSILPGKIASNNPNILDLVSSNGYLDVLECATQSVFMLNSHYSLVYTQLSDVEGELNGFFSYDRAEAKVDIKALAEIHKTLL